MPQLSVSGHRSNTWLRFTHSERPSTAASAHHSRRDISIQAPVGLAASLSALSLPLPAWARGGRQEVQEGMQRFRAGDVAASVACFDRAIEANPGIKPYLWQRGLALYYAEEYEKAAQQFREDVAVNPNDTEEAIWAYLAECQFLGPEKAREQLLKVGKDPREVLAVVYSAIKAGEEPQYLTSGAKDDFYLALYRGLYLEAQGETQRSAQEIEKAVKSRYSQKAQDYMISVASVHCATRAGCSATSAA